MTLFLSRVVFIGRKHFKAEKVGCSWKMLIITENLVEYCSNVSELIKPKGAFYVLLIFVVTFNDLSICLPFIKKKKKSVDHGKSWKMFCSHVESVLSLMLMGYNMENHRIHPLYWSSKKCSTTEESSFFFFIPVNLVTNMCMCSLCVCVCLCMHVSCSLQTGPAQLSLTSPPLAPASM